VRPSEVSASPTGDKMKKGRSSLWEDLRKDV